MRRILALLIAAPSLTAAQATTYSVTVADSARLHTVPTWSPISALVGKVPGGRVVATSNDPGSSPIILLRGAMASMQGEPLVVLDGAPSSLSLADINTDDVERVEIVNGAAGGAAYGSRGANGVVFITTRRARSAYVVARTDVGQTSLARHLTRSLRHSWQLDANGNFVLGPTGNRVAEPDGIQDNPYPAYYDLSRALLRERNVFSAYVAGARHLRGGRTRLAGSASDDQDGGVLAPLNGYSRSTGRLAFDQALTSRIDISATAFGARGRDADAGLISPFLQLSIAEPDMSPDSAVLSNPYFALDTSSVTARRDRFGWNARAEYRPLSWVWLRAGTWRDRSWEKSRHFLPSGGLFGNRTTIGSATGRHDVTEATLGARRSFAQGAVRATARFTFADETHEVTAGQEAFLDSAPPPPFPGTLGSFSRRGTKTRSYLLGATGEVGDRITLEGLVREDRDGRIVGSKASRLYYRISGAYDFGATKVRVAQGTAAPPIGRTATAPLGPICPTLGPCGSSLRMPHARETELGVEHRFRERYDVGYTLSRQRITDVLFLTPVPQPSTITEAWTNLGTTVAVAHEFSGRARLLSTPRVEWDLNLVAHTVRVKMKDMQSFRFFPAASALDGGNLPFMIANGQTLGVMYGYRAIRTEAQLLETIRAGALTGTAADFVRNGDGYYVRAADLNTPNERPLLYYACTGPAAGPCLADAVVRIGDANPDIDVGINTTLRWRAFTAYATVNAVSGGNVYNRSRQLTIFSNRDPMFDQSSKPDAERKPAAYYMFFYGSANELFVESGSFVKLSELAVDWRLPLRYPARVGVVGRNLFTTSGYGGYDPDAAAGQAGMFGYRFDGMGHPAYRTIGFRVQFGT